MHIHPSFQDIVHKCTNLFQDPILDQNFVKNIKFYHFSDMHLPVYMYLQVHIETNNTKPWLSTYLNKIPVKTFPICTLPYTCSTTKYTCITDTNNLTFLNLLGFQEFCSHS